MPTGLLIRDDDHRGPRAAELAGAVLGRADRGVVLDVAAELAPERGAHCGVGEEREAVHGAKASGGLIRCAIDGCIVAILSELRPAAASEVIDKRFPVASCG